MKPTALKLEPLAVNESGLIALLGMTDRPVNAAKKSAYKFRAKFNIKKLPGGVFSVAKIQQALAK